MTDSWLTVVIPMYNEQTRIVPTIGEFIEFVRRYPKIVKEFIFVDDGSRDASVEVVLSYSAKLPLRVLQSPQNKGKWAAVHLGMECAETDAVLLSDADGSANIFELERMRKLVPSARRLRKPIFGSRFMKGATIEGKSLVRTVLSRGYRGYVRVLYWCVMRRKAPDDIQCPMKLVFKSRISLEKMQVDRFAGDLELACLLEVPAWDHPVQFVHNEQSRMRMVSMFGMLWVSLCVAARCWKWRI
jgi:glycosyltransferase involved in cell wall biosynthesis